MDWWILLGCCAAIAMLIVASRRGWVDLSDKTKTKTSGSSGSLAHIGDEVFAPTRYEAAVELDRQTVLPAPAPVAGDGDKGIAASGHASGKKYDGTIRLDV